MNSDPYTNKFAKITLSSEEKIESKSQSRTFWILQRATDFKYSSFKNSISVLGKLRKYIDWVKRDWAWTRSAEYLT